MKSRCFRGHVSGCSKKIILKSRIQFCSHECLLAEAQLVAWLWEGMWLWHCPQNHNENVFISKKMRHKQAILVVSVWKQSAYYFFCYLTFGVIKSPLSQDLGQRLFHVRSLVLPYTKIQFVMNCLVVLPYLKFLGHYLFWHFCGNFCMSRGPLQKLSCQSRYEKRTLTCFWYHFKKRVGKWLNFTYGWIEAFFAHMWVLL